MDLSRRRAAKVNVVAGSVWESRIRSDEVRGGIRVFNGDDENAECGVPAAAVAAVSGGARRKTWKSDEGFNSILIAEEKPESSPSSGDEQNRKSPTPARRLRSNGSPIKPVRVSGEKTERNPTRKKIDQPRKSAVGIIKPPANGIGKNPPEKNECKEKAISSPPSQDFFDAFGEEIEKESFDVKEINLPERKKIVAETFPGNKQKLQTIMDLIMWRDFSRSALVFGLGNFVIILSYFIKNINISFISVISHMGLLFLAAIFVQSSIFGRRKEIDSDDEEYVVTEEELIRFAKRFVPFVNEFLGNLKALFRGDPSATMKLGILLFVLAKWGSFITLWNVLKCGFVGVFTLPKLITHGGHWMKFCGSSWKLCSQKKGMVVALFFIVWNFSSIIYRIWAAFIVFVSFRYYQESSERDSWVKNREAAPRRSDTDTVSMSIVFDGAWGDNDVYKDCKGYIEILCEQIGTSGGTTLPLISLSHPSCAMTSKKASSESVSSDAYVRPVTQSCSNKENLEAKEQTSVVMSRLYKRATKSPQARLVINDNPLYVKSVKPSDDPHVMSVMMAGVREDAMTEMEKKLNNLMKAVEERDLEITCLRNQMQNRETAESSQPPIEKQNDKAKVVFQDNQPHRSTSVASLSVQQLQDMINNTIRAQYDGPTQSSLLYLKPYTKRIDNLRMPTGYQPPKFKQFDEKDNPKQHIAHFVETCENAGTWGDLLVRQFVRTLKGNAFDWYTNLEPESIDSWEQFEREFLNRFYSTRRTVSMIELSSAKQMKGEPVIDYINRWRISESRL